MTEHERVMSLMPAGEFEAVWLIDGVIEREPIIGWALVETWMCEQERCDAARCVDADYHRLYDTEVRPVLWADMSYAEAGGDYGNGKVMPRGTTDQVARAWLEPKVRKTS